MQYIVSMAVESRISIEVEADNFMDAQEAALGKFVSSDLRRMKVVGFHAVNAESETGKFQDY